MFEVIKKHWIKTIILVIVFTFLFGYLNIYKSLAATIANREVRLSNTEISQASTYDFEGDLSGGAIKCLQVDFCTTASGTCTGPTGLTTASGSKAAAGLWNGFTYANWSFTSVDANTFRITSATSDSPTTDTSWAIADITNSSLAGTYYALINTYSNQNCTGVVDNGVVAFINTAGGTTISVTIPSVGNPLPTLTSINPSSKIVGSSGFTMTLTGTNFITSSVVRFAGSDRSTTYINSTTLQATILDTDLQTVGDFNITVFNPSPGGGESNAVIFSVTSGGGPGPGNPVPVLSTINPSSKNKGDPGFTMTLTGSNFITSSVVRFAGSDRSTTYINATTLQAQILASDLQTAGNFNITVFNPSPGGGESNAKPFQVVEVGENPLPILTAIDPSSKLVGSPGFVMTLTGSNFISSSVVRFQGSDRTTTYLNETTLQAEISASDLTTAGNFNITVFNPSPGGGQSGAKVFTVNNPLPVLTSIDPVSKLVGSPGFMMTVTGSNFVFNSVVRFQGADRVTTFINSTTLRAEIPASDLERVGSFYISVFNPGPGGGVSAESIIFSVVYPSPNLETISPSWKTRGSPGFSMTLTGNNFIPNSVVRFHGSDRQTTYLNSTTLRAEILATDLQRVGSYNITVFNPGPGGGESNTKPFQVVEQGENPLPILTAIDPDSKIVGSPGFIMTLTGSAFIPNSLARFQGSNRLTTYLNETTLRAEIPASDLTTVGNFNITVFNPGPGGGESGAKIFTVMPIKEEEKKPEEEEPSPELPAPIISRPLDGTITNQKLILIQGSALANQPIDILVNGEKIKTVYSNREGKFELSVELTEGVYLLNAALKGKKSKDINLTIDLTPPEPPVLLEARVIKQKLLIEKINVTLFVRGESSVDTVSLKAIVNPEFVFGPGSGEKWEKEFILDLFPGEHQIYALAYDLAGNESLPSNILTFKVGLPPTPIREIQETIKKVIDHPQVERVVSDTSKIAIPAVTTISIGMTAAAAVSSGLSLLQFLSALYLLLTQPFAFIFFRKRKRGWGVVYNSLTKQPVDLAVVRLIEAKTNRLVSTKVTDKEGRYIFIVDPGTYKITVDKAEYKFPTKFLAGFKEDFRFLNLYHGEEVEVRARRTVINASIPLDPEKKFKSDEWLIKDYAFFSFKKAVPIAAFIFSLLSYLIKPSSYLLIFIFLNLLLYGSILFMTPRARKDWGIVYEKEKRKPLPLTVVRIFEATFNKLLDQQVTNTKGQYGFLVGGRKFYLTYSKTGYQEKKSEILDFENKEKGAVVNLDVYLAKLKEEQAHQVQPPNFLKSS